MTANIVKLYTVSRRMGGSYEIFEHEATEHKTTYRVKTTWKGYTVVDKGSMRGSWDHYALSPDEAINNAIERRKGDLRRAIEVVEKQTAILEELTDFREAWRESHGS